MRTGVSDGAWVEVTGKPVRSHGSSEGTWEAVIVGSLSELCDGTPVDVGSENK